MLESTINKEELDIEFFRIINSILLLSGKHM